jgi:hypothetical protein
LSTTTWTVVSSARATKETDGYGEGREQPGKRLLLQSLPATVLRSATLSLSSRSGPRDRREELLGLVAAHLGLRLELVLFLLLVVRAGSR